MPREDGSRDVARNEKATLSQGAGLNFLGKVFRGGVQYLYLQIISRVLGVETFGLYMLGYTVVSLSEVISRFGLDLSVTRYVSFLLGVHDSNGVRSTIRKALTFTCIFSILVAALLFFTADSLWAEAFDSPDLGYVLRLLSISVPLLSVMAVALAATQAFQVMRYSVYTQAVFHPLTNLILVLLFYLLGGRLEGVIHAWLVSTFLAMTLSLYYLRKLWLGVPTKGTTEVAGHCVPTAFGLLGYASPLVLVVVLTSLLMWTDTIMLGYFRTETEVGIYSAAMRTAMLLGVILVSFNAVFAPMIADLHHRGKRDRLESLLKLTGRWIFGLTVPAFLFLFLLPEDVMNLFGTSFGEGKNALVILAVAHFINASTGPVGNVLVMTGHQRIMLINSVGMFLLNVVANYTLIPRYGIEGAALASAASVTVYNLLMLAEVNYFLHMHPYSRTFLRVSFVGAVSALPLWYLSGVWPSSSILKIVVFAPLFLLVLYSLLYRTCLSEEDREMLDGFKAKLRPNRAPA